MEAEFGLNIRDSKPSDTSTRRHADPMDVDAVISRLAEEKGHQVRVIGVLSAVAHIFNETAMHAKAQATNRTAKANRASHRSKSEPSHSGKGKSKENNGKSKGTKSANQGAKGLHKGKTLKTGLSKILFAAPVSDTSAGSSSHR